MEQLTIRYSIESKFLDVIRMLFRIFLTEFHDHLRNVETAAADLIASAALQADILDIICTLF